MDRVTERPAERRPWSRRVALQVSVALIVLSSQVNLLRPDYPLVYLAYYTTLFVCFVAVLKKSTILALGLACLVLATTLTGNPLKGLGLGIAVYVGYAGVKYYETEFNRVLIRVFLVTYVLTLLQFFGVSPDVYRFTDYANEAVPAHYSDDENFGSAIYLPQIRPSGIFPSPTYVSAFVVLLFSALVTAEAACRRRTMMLIGSFFAVLGSSVGLVLAAASCVLIVVRPRLFFLALGYAMTMFVYARYLPAWFAYNFGLVELAESFRSRLGFVDVAGESVLQSNLAAFAAICVGAVLAIMLLRRVKSLLLLVPLAVALSLPVLVHDVTFSIFYWFMVAATLSRLSVAGVFRRVAAKGTYPPASGPVLQTT